MAPKNGFPTLLWVLCSAGRIQYGFPHADPDVVFNDANESAILAIVNSVAQDGISGCLMRLSAQLTPYTDTYNFSLSRAVLDVHALFVWTVLTPTQRATFGARYAVAFVTTGAGALTSGQLAYTLLRFMHSAWTDYVLDDFNFDPRRCPKMRRLTYILQHTGAIGIMMFDGGLQPAYFIARAQAIARSECTGYFGRFAPTTSFPIDGCELRAPEVLMSLRDTMK
ncbi:hypothetical protein B0H21DRAFT_707799 [Amylocystis lapponica]|nr:hypothetical protein B0H21DRAFT_707799 [Amylocystis lapponica]